MVVDSHGAVIRLGARLGGGAEGDVFEVSRPGLVAKILLPSSRKRERLAKLRVMAARAPTDPTAALGHPTLCWPRELVFDGPELVGFLMPRLDLDACLPLQRFMFPRLYPARFHWGLQVEIAANLAAGLGAVHAEGYVVGDLNFRNVHVTRQCLITFLDCDSMQVTDPASGRLLRCPVGMPEYLAPELQGVALGSVERTEASDSFAFAVMVCQLLLTGTHPFAGGSGPTREENILRNECLLLGGSLPRGTPSPAILPPALLDLLTRCFRDGYRSPGARPKIHQLAQVLALCRGQLGTCGAFPDRHVFGDHLVSCPWCGQLRLGIDSYRVGSQAGAPGAAASAGMAGMAGRAGPASAGATGATATSFMAGMPGAATSGAPGTGTGMPGAARYAIHGTAPAGIHAAAYHPAGAAPAAAAVVAAAGGGQAPPPAIRAPHPWAGAPPLISRWTGAPPLISRKVKLIAVFLLVLFAAVAQLSLVQAIVAAVVRLAPWVAPASAVASLAATPPAAAPPNAGGAALFQPGYAGRSQARDGGTDAIGKRPAETRSASASIAELAAPPVPEMVAGGARDTAPPAVPPVPPALAVPPVPPIPPIQLVPATPPTAESGPPVGPRLPAARRVPPAPPARETSPDGGSASPPAWEPPPAPQGSASRPLPVDPEPALRASHDEDAEARLRAAVDGCRQRHDDRCELAGAIELGACQRALDELPAAEVTLRRALALAREPALRRYEAAAESDLAGVLLALHRPREAFAMAVAAANLATRRGDDDVRADSLEVVALALAALGNPGGAAAAAADAERAAWRVEAAQRRSPSMLRRIVTLAAIRRRLGDCARAEPLFGEVLAAAPDRALGPMAVEAHLGLARCARRQGDAALEREHLREARIAAQEHELALDSVPSEDRGRAPSASRPRAHDAWRPQTAPLRAAEEEARQAPGGQDAPGAAPARPAIPPNLAYAFALLYESDGNSIAELRALLRVPSGAADAAGAAAMVRTLFERVRVVTGMTLLLRDGPTDEAMVSQQLEPGTWIEIVGRSGGWIEVRTESRSGFVKDVAGRNRSPSPVKTGD